MKGKPGADSSNIVTARINDKSLIDLAIDLFGAAPAFWGRYFTSVQSTGVVEYRHLKENQILRDNGIRVLPIARQTKRVGGTQAQGATDAEANAEDILQTFGVNYLSAQGGQFLVFLDVESTPPMSVSYYKGWAQTLKEHSQKASNNLVTLLPCVYGTHFDEPTWRAVAAADKDGVACEGIWIARWKFRHCAAVPDYDASQVSPQIQLSCPVLVWQYSDECHGGDGFDCNQINPHIDQDAFLQKLVLPPEIPVA
jgi:hypothetical protein